MDPLLENELIQLFEHPERKLIRVVRSARRPERQEAIVETYREALGLLRPEHASWGVLIDVRSAPGVNDEPFERSVEVVRSELASRVARVVFLVSSAVGALQVNRVARESGTRASVTQDEDEALRWATGEA
ncbi:MAG: hypothetical protein KC776_41690 [Myxococcales bacterium]|nr:hypothetical protein [Myxococcales bacterium]MCB9581949.1 hypothetical protein [Polyangiaceae bacterium]